MRTRRWLILAVVAILLVSWSAQALVVTQVYTTDFILLYSLGFFLAVDHSDFIGLFAAPELYRLHAGNTLYLIDHGGPGSFGSHPPMDGTELAQWLTLNHAPLVALNVYVGTCLSGSPAAGGNPSLIAATGAHSTHLWRFTGFTGCAVAVRGTMADRIVNPAHEVAFEQEQVRLELKYQPQQKVNAFLVQYRGTHGGNNPPLLEAAKWAYNNQDIKLFYSELLTTARSKNWLYPAGQGVVHVPGAL
jgi:hypothetical protein